MSLSLSQRIALNEQKNPARRKNLYGPSFLALKTDITVALQDGWSMRQIWSTLKEEKKIGCSYLWFRSLVKKH
ncbi:TraK family protein, partial [Nitrosococcus oceani]|uniref:TraK family protein n=1 Tax=Nitrosococcus oceani TaxID=1229 RepID=UPI0004E91EC2